MRHRQFVLKVTGGISTYLASDLLHLADGQGPPLDQPYPRADELLQLGQHRNLRTADQLRSAEPEEIRQICVVATVVRRAPLPDAEVCRHLRASGPNSIEERTGVDEDLAQKRRDPEQLVAAPRARILAPSSHISDRLDEEPFGQHCLRAYLRLPSDLVQVRLCS